MFPAALAFLDVHHPTPIKYTWLALIVAAAVLKLLIIGMLTLRSTRFPAFRIFLLISAWGGLIQTSRLWNLEWEIALAGALGLFVLEILFVSGWSVRGQFVRRYDRNVSAFAGLILFAVMLIAAPAPYPGYPPPLYYTRLYTAIIAEGMVIAAAIYYWFDRIGREAWVKWHNACAIFYIAIPLAAAGYRGSHRWEARIVITSLNLACLSVWLWLSLAREDRVCPDVGPVCSASIQ
jgi:hypothetical protein